MLSISLPIKDTGAAKYYVESYYLEEEQAPSVTHGTAQGILNGGGAKALNHRSPLTRTEFTNLLNGLSPDGTKRLVQNAGSEHRQCGWDCTFSAPKSLSALYAVSPAQVQRKIESLMHRAAAEGAAVLEELGGWSRRGKAGSKLDKASLVFTDYLHTTSRANDAALHVHKFLFNFGFRPDGTTGALWTEEIFRNKVRAGQVFRDALARMIQTELGLEVEPRKVGFHIKGVPQELCDAFSKRRRQIELALAAKEKSGPVAAKIAALNTRPPKKRVPLPELLAYWARVGQEFGFGPTEAATLLFQGACSVKRATELSQQQQQHLFVQQYRSSSDGEASNAGNEHSRAEAHDSAHGQNTKHNKSSAQRGSNDGESTDRAERRRQAKPGEAREGKLGKHPSPFGWCLLFPEAPEWSPFKNWKAPFLLSGIRNDFRRWGKIKFQKKYFFAEIRVQQRYLFPHAPSSLREFSLPSLRILSPSQLRAMKARKEHFKTMEERLSQ